MYDIEGEAACKEAKLHLRILGATLGNHGGPDGMSCHEEPVLRCMALHAPIAIPAGNLFIDPLLLRAN